MWAAAIGAVAEVVKEWFTNRREESKAKHEQKLEKLERDKHVYQKRKQIRKKV